MIQKKDVEDVVTALERLYGDVNLSEGFGLSGRKKIEERYSLSAMEKDTLELYKSLINPTQ